MQPAMKYSVQLTKSVKNCLWFALPLNYFEKVSMERTEILLNIIGVSKTQLRGPPLCSHLGKSMDRAGSMTAYQHRTTVFICLHRLVCLHFLAANIPYNLTWSILCVIIKKSVVSLKSHGQGFYYLWSHLEHSLCLDGNLAPYNERRIYFLNCDNII